MTFDDYEIGQATYHARKTEADLQAQLAQAVKDWKVELDGTLALRKRFGAKDDETFPAFVERLAQDLAQVRQERVKDVSECVSLTQRLEKAEQENSTLRQRVGDLETELRQACQLIEQAWAVDTVTDEDLAWAKERLRQGLE
jgi:hypothetical protein